MSAVRLAILVRHHAYQLFAAHLRAEGAADAAIGACGDHTAFGRANLDDFFLDKRGGRASLHTGAAGNAFGSQKIVARQTGRNFGIPPTAFHGERQCSLNLVACAYAARTGNTFAGIEIEIGIRMVLFLTQMGQRRLRVAGPSRRGRPARCAL